MVIGFFRWVLRLFFRRIECEGADRVPVDRGGVLIAWHPNGLIDPGLIMTSFPGRVVFGARHGLLSWPVLGWFMRKIGTVPIYRAQDKSQLSARERQALNQASLDALAAELAAGSFSALFPEGVSHDEPHLMELKTGAARLYYRARRMARPGAPAPAIIPVGLHYDRKRLFRSRALVVFHAPLEPPADLDVNPDESDDSAVSKDRVRRLTELMEKTLVDVVHATESWELHDLMHRARKLLRAERSAEAGLDPGRPTMAERELGFERIWRGYLERIRTHPVDVERLKHRLRNYDRSLRSLGLEDYHLDRHPKMFSPWLGLLLALQAAAVYLFLPPLLLAGYVINGVPLLAILMISKLTAKSYKDEASIKIIAGAILLPAFWVIAATLASRAHTYLHYSFPSIPNTPILAGIVTALIGFVGGVVALHYNFLARQTFRALRVRFTRLRRRDVLERLLDERSALRADLAALGTGLDLPGTVEPSGRVTA